MPANATLQAITAAFSTISQLPYCSGTVPLTAAMSTLFYTSKGQAELIDFTKATDSQLSALSDACQQATFGLNEQNILDESYRRAGKLDATDFAIQFSPLTCGGISETIRDSLLTAQHAERSIQMELYKLNVYGPGSFFKAHIDTPRSETMFGSLVIVLPTVHEGGSLIVRHAGKEQVFDTALAVKSINTQAQAAFVAFYSDVEHEVALVTSGYRVTLTYNLYLTDSQVPIPPPLTNSDGDIEQLKNSLSSLLSDPKFLPQGGLLGFGLVHRYPFKPATTKLTELSMRLKGSDAYTRRICKALSLDVSLKALYMSKEGACVVDKFANFDGSYVEDEDIVDYIVGRYKGTRILELGDDEEENEKNEKSNEYSDDSSDDEYDEYDKNADAASIVWIKPITKSNTFQSTYLAYGNEPSVGYAYGEVCLVATIAAAEDRDAN